MGVYSTIGESTIVNDELLTIDPSNDDIQESAFDVSVAGAYGIMAENEFNYNQIMKAVGIFELKSVEESGEIIYEAVDIKGFISRLKAFFVKILQKIAAVVKKFFSLVDSMSKNDKDFIKKYEGHLLKMGDDKLKDLDMDLYTYTPALEKWSAGTEGRTALIAIIKKITGVNDIDMEAILKDSSKILNFKPDVVDNFKKALGEASDEDLMDAVRGSLTGVKSDVDSSDFSNAIHTLFRTSDSRESTSVTHTLVVKAIADIKGTDNLKKIANKDFDGFKKDINNLIKNLDKLSTNLNDIKKIPEAKADNAPTYSEYAALISRVSGLNRSILNLTTVVFNGRLSALKERNSQSRHICVRAMSYGGSFKEGFEHFEPTGSFFDDIKLR